MLSSPGPAARPPSGRPAPPVPDAARAQVRGEIGRLGGHPDPDVEGAFARALCEALGDRKPESLATYRGLAGEVRRGALPEACLQGAFEAACGRGMRNRGSVLVDAVRRWLRANGRRSGGRPPGPGRGRESDGSS